MKVEKINTEQEKK